MAINPDLAAALQQNHIGKIALLVELHLDSGSLYFTTNYSDLEYNGNTYEFLGALGSVSNVKESNNLDPADYEIVLGATDTSLAALFLTQQLINRTCAAHWCIINDEGVIVPDPVLLFRGLLQPAELTFGESATIKIPATDILSDWDRDIRTLYTHEQQIRDYPNDYCFSDISSTADQVVIWPASSYWD